MTHQHLALQLAHGFHRDGNGDHQRGGRERQIYLGDGVDDRGDHRENRQIDRAEGGDAGADLLNEVAGGLALANAGDHTAVVLDILRNFNRVEADRRIEEREAEDHQRKDQLVAPAHGGDMVGPPVIRGGVREERQNGRRELHDGAREDQRQDAGGVQLQRDVRGLAAVHSAADHALGVLNRNTTLAELDEHDAEDQDHEHDDRRDHRGDADLRNVLEQVVDVSGDARGDVRGDAGEDQQADAVADAALRDALTDPHGQRGARRKAETDGQQAKDGVGGVRLHAVGQRDGLDEAEADGDVTGDLSNLLLALFTLLLKLFELRNGDAQQLHDNGCVDVRGDAHGHDVVVGEIRTGHRLNEAENRIALQNGGDSRGVNAGGGDVAEQSVDQQHTQRIQDLLADFDDLPCVTQSLTHFRSPLLSRLPPRSSALRTRRTCSPEP